MRKDHDYSCAQIREYLGASAAVGGPFAVLGVGHGPLDQSIILRACQARLAQINGHPRGQSQAADDVRMAVHAAASQLLDPDLRDELVKLWPEGTDDFGIVGESPTAWRVDAGQSIDSRLIQHALMLVGACGGWNSQSRKRLGQFARLNALSASQLVGGIIRETGAEAINTEGQTDRGARSVGLEGIRGPSLMDPREGALPWGLIPVLFMFMAMSLVAAGYVSSFDRVRSTSREGSAVSSEAASGATNGFIGQQGSRSSSVGDRRHYSAIVYELEKFARESVVDTDGASQFSELGDRLVRQWTELPASDLDRAVHSVRTVLGNTLSTETFDSCVSFLQTDDAYTGSMLNLGLRSWFFGSADQIPDYSLMIARAGEIDQEGAFDRAIASAFLSQRVSATDDPDWWRWWIGQLEPVRERSGEQRDSLLLSAAYQRMVHPEMGDAWDSCVQQIVQSLQWGGGSIARSWVLGVVVDPAVQSERLGIFSRGMVLYSSARGLGMDMMLQGDESILEREAYLTKLRNRWAEAGTDGADVRSASIERMQELVQITRHPAGREQSMIRCVELARVNSVGWLLSRSDEAGAYLLMDSYGDPIDSVDGISSINTIGFDLASSVGDEAWATQARNLETQDELVDHLSKLVGVKSIGPKSGHALVYLAMSAPNLSVRSDAEQLILSRPDEPAVLIAMDRVVGSERVSRRVVELVNTYLGVHGSSIDSQLSRYAILGRLAKIGLLEDGSNRYSIQGFENSIKLAYSHRLVSGENADSESVYRSLATEFLRDGHRVSQATHSRLLVRLRRADGPVQRFAAYQAAMIELQIDRLLRSHPGLGSRVQRVQDELELREQNSADIFESMLNLERAQTELWLIELEMEVIS